MGGIPFVVNDKPFVCWDPRIDEKNLEFLRGIDGEYFEHVARTNFEFLNGEKKHHAALSIRQAYSQSLEILFALLAALSQAPNCPLGWMLAYRNDQLTEVVRKISNGRPVLNRGRTEWCNWPMLCNAVHSRLGYDQQKRDWIRHGFAECWARFAIDFLDQNFLAEYNSMKHGMRVTAGGCGIAIGLETTPGVPADDWEVISHSVFGTSCFGHEEIGSAPKMHFRPRYTNSNWSPTNISYAVVITAMSIDNVASYLRILNGDDPTKCRFRTPEAPESFSAPWAENVVVPHFSMDTLISEKEINQITAEDVLRSYDREDTAAAQRPPG